MEASRVPEIDTFLTAAVVGGAVVVAGTGEGAGAGVTAAIEAAAGAVTEEVAAGAVVADTAAACEAPHGFGVPQFAEDAHELVVEVAVVEDVPVEAVVVATLLLSVVVVVVLLAAEAGAVEVSVDSEVEFFREVSPLVVAAAAEEDDWLFD